MFCGIALGDDFGRGRLAGGGALGHVSLTIEPGSFVVALGASGCGKSTLLNLMAGFLKPSSGSVSFGREMIERPGSERGVVFQHGALMPWLNGVDNVAELPIQSAELNTLLG